MKSESKIAYYSILKILYFYRQKVPGYRGKCVLTWLPLRVSCESFNKFFCMLENNYKIYLEP